MKTVITVVALMLTIGSASAQKVKAADVPANVKEAFTKQFPDAEEVEWEKEGTDFEIEFEMHVKSSDPANSKKVEIEKSALFSAAGKLLQTEEEIKISDLPKGVSEYVTANMLGKKISEASKITEANGTIMYEAEVSKEDYIFDSHGKFIKKEVKKDDDDKKK